MIDMMMINDKNQSIISVGRTFIFRENHNIYRIRCYCWVHRTDQKKHRSGVSNLVRFGVKQQQRERDLFPIRERERERERERAAPLCF